MSKEGKEEMEEKDKMKKEKLRQAVGCMVVQGSTRGLRRPKKVSFAKMLKILVTSRSYWKIISCVPDFYAGTPLANFGTGHISTKDMKQFFSN